MDYDKTQPAPNCRHSQDSKPLVGCPSPSPVTYYTVHSTQPTAFTSGCSHAQRRRRACSRFGHALLLALLICILLPVAARHVHHIERAMKHFFGGSNNGSNHEELESPVGDFELPSDCVQVAEWTKYDGPPDDASYRLGAYTSLELPVSSDLLYFISRGGLSFGVLEITEGGDAASDQARVDVTFLYQTPVALDHAKVCRLEKEQSSVGVGIFSPNWTSRPRPQRAQFRVHIQLPRNKDGLREIKGLETDMPMFQHEIGSFEDDFFFDYVSLRTANAAIKTKYLSSREARFHTSNAPIGGKYNSTGDIEFKSSNGPISVDVTLVNDGSDGKVNKLTLRTSNSPAAVDVTLESTAKGGAGGSFDLTAQISNGPLNVKTTTAPVDSLLRVKGSTSNAVARATLHPTYEGSFIVRSSPFFGADVRMEPDQEDPAGKGRKRNLELRSVRKGVSEGKVTWPPVEDREMGSVVLSTSNSPAHLFL